MKRIKAKYLRQAQLLAMQPYYCEYSYDKECECWGGQCPELLGCVAQGATLTDARLDLYEVRLLYIALLLENGQDVPKPKGVVREAVWYVYDGEGQLL
jgi:predicted RNase H-like HicB family nuclease